MRGKKSYVILTFSTTTEAMKMEALCGQKDIPGRLIPVPGAISAGCGLCFRIPDGDYLKHYEKIHSLGVIFEGEIPFDM